MKHGLRALRRAVVLSMSLLMGISGCFEGGTSDGNAPRSQAPHFNLIRLDGLPVSLEEHLGKTVILDFWATWCAPCEVQMPVLDTLWEMRGRPRPDDSRGLGRHGSGSKGDRMGQGAGLRTAPTSVAIPCPSSSHKFRSFSRRG